MSSARKVVSVLEAAEPRRSKFRENFDAPLIESITDPTAMPTAEAGAPESVSTPVETSKTPSSITMILRSSRFSWPSWSSGSSKSSASAALKKGRRSPIKRLQEGAGKLLRSAKGN